MTHDPEADVDHLQIGANDPLARSEPHSPQIVGDQLVVLLIARGDEHQQATVDTVVVALPNKAIFQLAAFSLLARGLAQNGYHHLRCKN